MPPKGKARNAPNQHDKRHEGGLAAPGKRVSKRPSNGSLDTQANGKPVQSVAPPPLPTTGLNQGFTFSHARDAAASAAPTAPTAAATKEYGEGYEEAAGGRTHSDASMDFVGQYSEMDDVGAHEQYTSAAAGDTAGKHASSRPAGSSSDPVSTVVASYPIRDAIAILILMLSLSPPFSVLVQAVFTSLTFVPPSASFSFSSLPNLKEMFSASNLGSPALFTVVSVDVIFYLIFLLVWRPLQGIFLDLSHAVIAVSLSGAAASTGGATYSIATSSLIVCVVHVLRYKAIHLTALDYLRSVIHKLDFGISIDGPVGIASSYFSQPSPEPGWLYSFLRGLLGIHIVSQGVSTCIRRSLANANANEKTSGTPTITKTDPEATAGSDQTPRSNSGPLEGAQHVPAVTSGDGRPPGPSPAFRDSKARESNTKRKRRQATQVRSQQPLWAAIASTKVTFVKEMEQRETADDGREVSYMDTTNTSTSFAADYCSTTFSTGRIWMCEVRDTEILFTVELSSEAADESVERMEEGMGLSAGIDKSKPFFVRVNGAAWSSVRIWNSETEQASGPKTLGRYEAEIFGLAPLSSYHCEVVGIATQRVLCSASLITQPAPTAEQAASAPAQPQHQALRPSSPITTLKQSIQSAESKLAEIRGKSKKTRKDQKAANSEIKKEIAGLKAKLESSGGLDDKHRSRLAQIRQHKHQAEEATDEIKEQISSFGTPPAEETNEADANRRAWLAAKDIKAAATHEFDNIKAEAERDFASLRSELAAAESKRERLATRHAQKAKEFDKAQAEQHEKMTAMQRYEFERANRIEAREQEEQQMRQTLAQLEAERASVEAKTSELWPQVYALQNWQSNGFAGYSSPPTPESTFALPHTSGKLNSGMAANGFGALPTQGFSTFNSNQPLGPTHVPRGRSSSMLSQYSGFTEDDELDPWLEPAKQHSWSAQNASPNGGIIQAAYDPDRNYSEGSASGTASGASSSPRPDAKPFVPAKTTAPIGPPSKNSGDKVPQCPGLGSAGTVGYGGGGGR